ncbi:TPA: hypothetical protein ACQ31I_001083 [Yersinia enterocolitica]
MITFTGSQIISIFIQTDEVLKLGHQFPLLALSNQAELLSGLL